MLMLQNAEAQQDASTSTTKANVKYLTTAEFQQKVWNYRVDSLAWVYRSVRPCVIDFYATWCGPCRKLSPIIEELSAEQPGIDFYKVDVDKEKELASVFGVRSIPMLLFVPKKGAPQVVQGYREKALLQQIIDVVIFGRQPVQPTPQPQPQPQQK